MRRPGYREAIEWIAQNDDCHWTLDEEPIMSVTASMVRDLYDVPDAKVLADITRAFKRAFPNTR
jgi:hypothetical protein